MKKVLSSIFSFTLVLGLSVFGFNNASAQNDVTFTVDMSSYGGAFGTVYIAGGFNGWTDANPLTDMGSGIWSGVVSLADGDYECKFMLDNWADQEAFNGSEPCTTAPAEFVNRFFTVAGAPVSVGTFCWNSCDAVCTGPAGGSITFSVDMSDYPSSFTTVSIFGTFNGWCGACNPLTDMGNGIWEGSVNMSGGDNEYKFILDNGEEVFDGTESCTTEPAEFVNRIISVDGNATIPTVCYNSCDACGVVGTVNVLQNNELFTLQPTLVSQYTSLEFNLNTAKKEISIYNGMGQVFLSENIDQSVSNYEIYTSHFANGVYFIKVQMENAIQIERIMVSH